MHSTQSYYEEGERERERKRENCTTIYLKILILLPSKYTLLPRYEHDWIGKNEHAAGTFSARKSPMPPTL